MMICEHGIDIKPKVERVKQADGQERFFIKIDYCQHCCPKILAAVPREVENVIEDVIFVPAKVS